MDAANTYLLKKICGYKTNGLNTLGNLNGKHVDDISQVMMDFAEDVVKEFAEKLSKGPVRINGLTYSIQSPTKNKNNKP